MNATRRSRPARRHPCIPRDVRGPRPPVQHYPWGDRVPTLEELDAFGIGYPDDSHE